MPARGKFMVVTVGVLLFIPLSYSPDRGFGPQSACAQEEDGQGCCFNPIGICDVGGQPQHQYENKSWIQIIFGCGGP